MALRTGAERVAMIGRTIGRFRVLEQLGQGGMSTVWKAEDPLLRRCVALKLLSDALSAQPKARRRFLHEAVTSSRLAHPGIAAVYDTGEDASHCYIAFALIEGETLSDLIDRGPLDVVEAIRIVAAAADA